jgi:multidrug efflux system membrane fusion protein
MSKTSRLLFLLVIAAAAVGGWKWYQDREEKAPPPRAAAPSGAPPAAVVTEALYRGPMPIEIASNGLVVSEAVVTVRPRVDGQIERVLVQEGQMVNRGDPLFVLDSRYSQAILAQQEAQLARDRALAARAQSDLVRYQSLRGEGYAAQQRFEQAQADALVSQAVVKANEALNQQARLNVEFATITADMSGRLGALPLRAGNFVRQAENIGVATITQMDPILVQFSVPERWLPEIRDAMAKIGQEPPLVRVRPGAGAGEMVEGRLVFVDSSVDNQTASINLKARFQNADGKLWPGQFVSVTVIPRIEADAVAVPSAALQMGQDGRYVFVAENNIARRRPVELLRLTGTQAVIRGEFGPNDKVIVEGAQRVANGGRIVERPKPGTPAAQPQRISALTQ